MQLAQRWRPGHMLTKADWPATPVNLCHGVICCCCNGVLTLTAQIICRAKGWYAVPQELRARALTLSFVYIHILNHKLLPAARFPQARAFEQPLAGGALPVSMRHVRD